MNRRIMAYTLLVFVVCVGLIAGIYANAIQRALTLPMMQPSSHAQAASAAHLTTTATPTLDPQTSVLARDTFQRANQPMWGMASDKNNEWIVDAGTAAAFAIVDGTGQIAQSQGQQTFDALLGPSSSNVNVMATGGVNQFGDGVNLGVVLRWTNPNTWYKAHIDGSSLSLLKDVNGTKSTIASVPLPASGAAMYTLRFQAIGALLFVKAWPSDNGGKEPGAWQIMTNDTSLQTGFTGVRVVVQPATVVTIKTFIATTAVMDDTL